MKMVENHRSKLGTLVILADRHISKRWGVYYKDTNVRIDPVTAFKVVREGKIVEMFYEGYAAVVKCKINPWDKGYRYFMLYL